MPDLLLSFPGFGKAHAPSRLRDNEAAPAAQARVFDWRSPVEMDASLRTFNDELVRPCLVVGEGADHSTRGACAPRSGDN
ncbi:MAG: hypothetical protein HYY23_01040 [Verrucomicrobia bacterium]|nr:hypothetical protein [Verrucomicrobiota bacterium]